MSNRLDTRFVETEQYSELVDVEMMAENYIRANQSFIQMYFDEFTSITKTDPTYVDKVDVKRFKMTPGSGSSWLSKQWTAASSVSVCKIKWRATSDFDHDIEVSANNGSNWEVISVAGATTNKDKEIIITNPGTQIILRVLNGTQGSLLGYVLLVK